MFLEHYNFFVKTQKREQFIPITEELNSFVKKSGARNGFCKVFIPHTTAAVTINENADPDVISDITKLIDEMAPHQLHFLHSEGNSDAHMKSSLLGVSLEIPIEEGFLGLGQWQGVISANSMVHEREK